LKLYIHSWNTFLCFLKKWISLIEILRGSISLSQSWETIRIFNHNAFSSFMNSDLKMLITVMHQLAFPCVCIEQFRGSSNLFLSFNPNFSPIIPNFHQYSQALDKSYDRSSCCIRINTLQLDHTIIGC
jgi:hypothetical protein